MTARAELLITDMVIMSSANGRILIETLGSEKGKKKLFHYIVETTGSISKDTLLELLMNMERTLEQYISFLFMNHYLNFNFCQISFAYQFHI